MEHWWNTFGREGGREWGTKYSETNPFPVSLQNLNGRLRVEPGPLRWEADGLPPTSEQYNYI